MKNPLCIITWASGDIGSELSLRLWKKYKLALIGRNQKKLQSVLNQIPNKENKAYVWDINDDQKREEIVKQIILEQWNPSVIIHGAAAFGDPKKLHNYTDQEIEEIINTNFTTIAKLTKDLVPYMNWWAIITIWSTSYKTPYPKRLLYAATKRALQSYTETNAIDYQSKNIWFYYVVPWPTEWQRVDQIIQERVKTSSKDLSSMEQEYKRINGGEFLKTQNITDTIQMILHDTLQVSSGATLGIDNFGIFEESYPDFATNHWETHEFLSWKLRKYIHLRENNSPMINNQKQRTYRRELANRGIEMLVKYGAAWLLIRSLIQITDISRQQQKITAYLQKTIKNTKNYEYEMEKIAREQYGIKNPSDLIEKSNKLQQTEPIELYLEIGQQARENMKKYEEQWYEIYPHSTKKSIDI